MTGRFRKQDLFLSFRSDVHIGREITLAGFDFRDPARKVNIYKFKTITFFQAEAGDKIDIIADVLSILDI